MRFASENARFRIFWPNDKEAVYRRHYQIVSICRPIIGQMLMNIAREMPPASVFLTTAAYVCFLDYS